MPIKLKKAPNELANIEYIQNQINKIRDSVEDRQSRIPWQTVNKLSRRKSTAKAKLKVTSQQAEIQLCKQHFENLLRNPLKVIHYPITRIISKQLDIELEQFMQKELNSVLRKIKNRKAPGLDEIPPRNMEDQAYCSDTVIPYKKHNRQMDKGRILPFPKESDFRSAKNYRGITITPIAAKIYNALLHNCIEPKIENILRKTQNGFRRNRSMTSQILTICQILEEVCAKNLEATILFVNFTKAFDSMHRGKIEQILLAYGLPKESIAAIMMLYKNTKVKVLTDKMKCSFFQAAVMSILL